MDTNNTYMVTVKATDRSKNTDTQDVTVTVTDEDEPGTVTGLPASARVGAELTATLTDPDAGVANTTWQWASAGEDGTYIDIVDATSASYTVADSDAGMSLMATATYDDVHGTDKKVPSAVVMVTPAAPLPTDYDTNKDGEIDIEEIRIAYTDFIDGIIEIDVMREIFVLFIESQ